MASLKMYCLHSHYRVCSGSLSSVCCLAFPVALFEMLCAVDDILEMHACAGTPSNSHSF